MAIDITRCWKFRLSGCFDSRQMGHKSLSNLSEPFSFKKLNTSFGHGFLDFNYVSCQSNLVYCACNAFSYYRRHHQQKQWPISIQIYQPSVKRALSSPVVQFQHFTAEKSEEPQRKGWFLMGKCVGALSARYLDHWKGLKWLDDQTSLYRKWEGCWNFTYLW